MAVTKLKGESTYKVDLEHGVTVSVHDHLAAWLWARVTESIMEGA